MIVSRSRKMHPQSPTLTIFGTVLNESDNLDILEVIFDTMMTFEKYRRYVFREVSHVKTWFLEEILGSITS